MLSIREIETLYQTLSRDQLDILLEIHNLVAQISPSADVDPHRKGLTYYDPSRGGHVSAGICQTFLAPDHIRLAFIHGACLPDPRHLLQGRTYPKRFLIITSYDSAPWEDIEDLIRASASFDPYAWSAHSS